MPTARYLDQPYLLAGRRIDPITGTLSYREVQKHLRRKELEVLALLAAAGGEQVARSVFIEQVWQGNPIVGEQGLTDTISALRRSLMDTDRQNPLILTIPRRGYQLRGSVRWMSRDGGVAFVAGSVIEGRPDWRLKQLLEQTDAHESWLAEDGRGRRIFRFCRNEQQLRKLRREVVLMRYLREALASQEQVSTILDWQLEEPPYFLELAAPACGNLRGVMLGKSVPEPPERWRLMYEVATALAATHAAGVVHRNLSPDSVLVDRREGERVALLGEFGLAALDDRQRLAELGIDAEDLSLKTGLRGPATVYTAPECVAGAPASAASDVYALGVLIAQTVRGDFQRLEFSGFEEFPAPLAALLQAAVAADPAARPTAAAVAGQWRAALLERAESSTDAAPVPVPVSATSIPAESVEPVPPFAATLPGTGEPPSGADPRANQRIGRYRIVCELAQGGMGVVYLAEQSEPVQRRVALKLIRSGLDSAQVLARFDAERQALAMMNHPNISAIFDAGTTADGYPYFVMEYVPGTDIKTFCDEAKLDVRARIRLFLQVCDGALHAHQKGLIHRDLKPGNILVRQKSEQPPLVKLIDFGVAKSLTGGLGAGLQTQFGSFVGTPVYSCPEQVIYPTQDIDTRADLYSLGVVLYELLTGVPPRTQKELDADSPAELARRLRNTRTPPMGSRYAALSAEERQRIADVRAMSEQGLTMQLGSDLDWIVGKCIAQDPEDRYATVQDLRRDLQRWLDDRPVEARPASGWYRFRKLIRRNRLRSAVVLLMVTGLLSTTFLALIAYRAAAASAVAASAANVRAQQEKDANDLVVEFLIDIFRGASPYLNTDGMPTVEQLVESGSQRLAANSQLSEDVRAKLSLALAEVFGSIGEYRRSIEMAHSVLKDATPEHAFRAHLILSGSHLGIGDSESAIHSALRAIEIAQSNRFEDRLLADAELSAGIAYGRAHEHSKSLPHLERALIQYKESLGEAQLQTLKAMSEYGSALSDSGRVQDAEPILRRALELSRKLRGRNDVELVYSLFYLGQVLVQLNRGEEALPLYREGVEIVERSLGKDHPEYITTLSNYAYALEMTGNNEPARSLRREILEMSVARHGRSGESVVRSMINLATNLLADPRDPAAALRLLDEAIVVIRAQSTGDALLAIALQRRAEALFNLDALKEAAASARQALQMLTARDPGGSLREAAVRALISRIELARGDLEQSRQQTAAAATLYQEHLSEGHWRARFYSGISGVIQSIALDSCQSQHIEALNAALEADLDAWSSAFLGQVGAICEALP